MANAMAKIADGLDIPLKPISNIFMKISLFFLAVMPLPIFVDVLARWIMNTSIPGIPEITEFLMVLAIFPALAFINIREGQIRIDILLDKFPPWGRNILNTIAPLLTTLLFALMAYQLYHRGAEKFSDNEMSWVLHIPLGYFIWIASLGCALMTMASLIQFLRGLNRSLPDRKTTWLLVSLILTLALVLIPLFGFAPLDDSPITLGIIGMCFLFVLIFLGVPVGISMGIIGFLGMIIVYDDVPAAMANLSLAAYTSVASVIIATVPMFVLMGQLIYHSGISQDLFDTASIWLGRLRGGLAMSSIAGCAGFAAVCGDSLATAVTMGTIAVPEMKKKKYSMKLATASLAAGGTLGILIPPSIGFIFFAIVTEESIGKLFMAGLIPGLILAGMFMVTIYVMVVLNPKLATRGEKTTLVQKLVSIKGIFGMLLLFVIILGGILAGIFSPTEGGAIGAVGAFAFALIRRRLTLDIFLNSLTSTISITSRLIIILIGVGALGYFLAVTELPFYLADFVTGLGVNRYIILALVILLFIFLGCVMNVIPILLLILPTISPAMEALGFDNVWFGVVCVITMEMGQITPPIGVIVFAISGVTKDVSIEEIFKGIIPFFLCMIACIILITIFPELALWLPGLLFD